MPSLRIQALTGAELVGRLDALAALRIRIFHDWPYLYAGDADYERRYLRAYAEAAGSVIVGAFDDDLPEAERLVGAATGLPLSHEPAGVRDPFTLAGFDVDRIYYFGESLLLPAYRGRGVGEWFFREREVHARGLGGFQWLAFCAVIRRDDDPRRPADYHPLDTFWRKRGFVRHPGLTVSLSWQEIGEAAESPKPMAVWMKGPL